MIFTSSPPLRLSAYSDQDSDGNVMLKSHAYKAQSAGFVSARCGTYGTGFDLKGYVGLTSDPEGAGQWIGYNAFAGSAYGMGVTLLIAKGEYFEFITGSTEAIYIFWKSFGTLKKPIDFN